MKAQMLYSTLIVIADNIAKHIKENVPNPKLYAVARGGFTLAHRVGYKLALPVGVFYPKLQEEIHPTTEQGTRVFLEDVIATGRTVRAIESYVALQHEKFPNANNEYKIYPSVVDAKCEKFSGVVYSTARITSDWIVFPYEDYDAVSEGDRGMFREGTSNNSRALV